ncbi:MAG: hypothetical protein GDA44_03710 [Prochloron sp. SP5CPC1]|nr:hypothetical protein [Candidatus Paraprochloron terpiosi SP5CPC1]
MNDLGKRSNTLLIVIVVCSSIVCALLAMFGVAMVYLGATGKSDINLFGNSISSESVGVASIFVSGVVIIMLLRRTLVSHDQVMNPIATRASGGKVKNIDSNLREAIKRLYNVSTQLRDIILIIQIQKDAFEVITDRKAFNELKRQAI